MTKPPSPESSQAARDLVRNRWGPRLSQEEASAAIDNLIRLHGSIPKAAKALGVNKQSLYDYKSGKTGMPLKYKEQK